MTRGVGVDGWYLESDGASVRVEVADGWECRTLRMLPEHLAHVTADPIAELSWADRMALDADPVACAVLLRIARRLAAGHREHGSMPDPATWRARRGRGLATELAEEALDGAVYAAALGLELELATAGGARMPIAGPRMPQDAVSDDGRYPAQSSPLDASWAGWEGGL